MKVRYSEHLLFLAALHHRALDRGEAVGERADDQVVTYVGLGFDRAASVVLADQCHDPVCDLGQQRATGEWLQRRTARTGTGIAQFLLLGVVRSVAPLTRLMPMTIQRA